MEQCRQPASEYDSGRMVNEIIESAITVGASDIHLDPGRDGLNIRHRIDGALHAVRHLSTAEQHTVIAQLRQMAELPQAEPRSLQDGRLSISANGREYDLRISIMPMLFGEKVAMRIFDQSSLLLGLDQAGFTNEQLETVKRLLGTPSGMIISTGPAGSGKTTLLYSMIMEIADPAKSLVTIEDPIELTLPDVQQAQVSPWNDFTFGTALRGYMRQDADVILVGEMRDTETAALSAQSAMTGHLILSQMLVEDAISVPQELVDLGVDPWIVGRNLPGVIACRLARKVCQNCKEEYSPSAEAQEILGLRDRAGSATFYRGKGCESCGGAGHKGRQQLHEILVIDKNLSDIICGGETRSDVLLYTAVQHGFMPMIEDGKRVVLDGLVTAEEVCRVLSWR